MRLSLRTKLRLSLIRSVRNNENGAVLIISLVFMMLLAMLGITAVVMTTTDMKIGGNYKSHVQAFNVAQAGLEVARYQLKTNIEASTPSIPITIDTMLDDRKGANEVLSDSASANISDGTFPTDDVPLIAQTSFGGGTYRVYLTNDSNAPDVVTSLTDTNNRVTLTSFGQGPDNALVILQEVVQKLEVPPVPGAVVLPGPNVDFDGANSNASGIAGDTESAISVTSPAAIGQAVAGIPAARLPNYTCEEGAGAGIDCITNDLAVMEASEPPMTTAAEIESVAATFLSAADTYLPGPGPYSLGPADVGTTSDRRIVFVDGDVALGPSSGAGVLIVTGRLTISGSVNYYGLILCIGKGEFFTNGGGGGEVLGAIFIAKTDYDPLDNDPLTGLGTPTFDTGGGGNMSIRYDAGQLRDATGAKFLKKSWQNF